MNKYIIAIDGGGTKTNGALFDLFGKEICHANEGFSNFSVDEEKSKRHIESVIERLLEHTNDGEETFVVMGISGASKLSNPQRWVKEIEDKYHVKATLETDAMIALYSVDHKEDEDLIMIISGTGSVMMTKTNDDIQLQGGYGHLFGDEGSSYHLSLEAVKKVLEDLETGKPLLPFSKDLMNHLNVKTRSDIINYVYTNQKNDFSKLAIEVSKIALSNDKTAIQLLKNEGIYLGKQVERAHQRNEQKRSLAIALKGGFILNAPYVKEAFIDYISKNIKQYRIIEDEKNPLIGAYRLGLKKMMTEVML
jgi:N-acetylglucosamine kinase-like BadF-type ATPase